MSIDSIVSHRNNSRGVIRGVVQNFLTVVAITLTSCTVTADATQEMKCPNSRALDEAAFAMLQDKKLEGFAILAGDETGPKLRAVYGKWDTEQLTPVASAGKWIAAATILTLVDDGTLRLDEPISTWLPDTPNADIITLRQLMSHTSGIDPHIVFKLLGEDGVKASGRRILDQPLLSTPGSEFRYGGSSFQVAGGLAETVTGEKWQELFYQRIAAPLNITSARWGHPFKGQNVGTPQLGGGLYITLDDFGTFLTAILKDGTPILSKASIEEMMSDARQGANGIGVPSVISEPFNYGLGVWCEPGPDTECEFAHSTGAFGTMPWIDQKKHVWGVIIMKDRFDRVFRDERRITELVGTCVNDK